MKQIDKLLQHSLADDCTWPALDPAEAGRIKAMVAARLPSEKPAAARVFRSRLLLAAAIIATAGLLAAAAYRMMPQDRAYTAVEYDADDNFAAYYITDESGNTTVLDYIPQQPAGDITVNGYEDVFLFSAEEIAVADGAAGEHQIKSGKMAVYSDNGHSWTMAAGQEAELTFHIIPVEGRNTRQGIWFGYVKDGEYIRYGYDPADDADQSYMLKRSTTISFVAPEDGEYTFFVINFSSDTIYVESSEIEIV